MGFFSKIADTVQQTYEKAVDTSLDVFTLGQKDMINDLSGGKVEQLQDTLKLDPAAAASLAKTVIGAGAGGGAMNLSGLTGGIDLSKITDAGAGAANQLLANLVNKVSGSSNSNPVQQAVSSPAPVQQIIQGSSKLPLIIGGAVLLLGLLMFFFFRGKKK